MHTLALTRTLLTPAKAALLLSFAILQILDVVTTQQVLAHGGVEANPLAVWVMHMCGAQWPIPKLGLMAVCMLVLVRMPTRATVPFVVLMSIVVANNAAWAWL